MWTENLLLHARVVSSPAAIDNTVATVIVPGSNNQRRRIVGIAADYSAAVAAVKDIQILSGDVADDGLLNTTALSRGSVATAVASTAFTYILARTSYVKAAVTTGTALAAGTIPTNKWGIYRFSVNAAGTIASTAGAANFTTGYDNEAAALAALPATPASQASMGHVSILTAVGSPFVGGTDALEGGAGGNPSSDTNYYSTTALALTALDGIAPLRWNFNNGPFYLPMPGLLRTAPGHSLAVTLAASGAGGTTGRITVFYL